MIELLAQLDRFTDEPHNVAEFLVVDLSDGLSDEHAREAALSKWASEKGHVLRERLNPFYALADHEAEKWLGDRHFEDIVFGTKGQDEGRSRLAAAELIACIGPADYQWSDFPIDDWTFCDVLVVIQSRRAIVIAFMGED